MSIKPSQSKRIAFERNILTSFGPVDLPVVLPRNGADFALPGYIKMSQNAICYPDWSLANTEKVEETPQKPGF
jgi:hypothetical protein